MSKRKLQILPSTDEAVLAELEGPRRIPSVLSASAAQVNTIVTDDEESGVDTEDEGFDTLAGIVEKGVFFTQKTI